MLHLPNGQGNSAFSTDRIGRWPRDRDEESSALPWRDAPRYRWSRCLAWKRQESTIRIDRPTTGQTYLQNLERVSPVKGSSKDTLRLPGVLLTTEPVLYAMLAVARLPCSLMMGSTFSFAGEMMTEVPGLMFSHISASVSICGSRHIPEPIPRKPSSAFASKGERVRWSSCLCRRILCSRKLVQAITLCHELLSRHRS